MDPSRQPRQFWRFCGTVVLMAICLYAGCYFLMVQHALNGIYNVKDATFRSRTSPYQIVSNRPPKGAYPLYLPQYQNLFGKEAYFKSFFSPLHRLDRAIRRRHWEDD